MDMPPTGWYPDPYGVPGLLRWWDGSAWTEHTQSSEGLQGQAGPGGAPKTAPVTSLDLPPVTALDLPPADPRQPPRAAETAFDLPPIGPAFESPPDHSTRVYSAEDYSGYARAQRQRQVRRRWVMSGLAVGTAALLGIMAVVLLKVGKQPQSQAVALKHTPAARHTARATPSPTPSPTPSATPSASLISDYSSGLSYSQLGSPWQPQCPSGLSQQSFNWSAGESAVAGQVSVNGQQSSWYGNACSTTLPQQFGYGGVQDLASTAANVASTLENMYYNGLQHTIAQQLSQPLSIGSHAAWEVTYLVTYTDTSGQGLSWATEQGAVVIVDRGTGSPGVFYASVPANLGEQNVASLVSSLRMPSASSSASASPGGGGGNGGGNGNGGGD